MTGMEARRDQRIWGGRGSGMPGNEFIMFIGNVEQSRGAGKTKIHEKPAC